MPTPVDDFTPQKITEGIYRRLEEIEPGEGYNTRLNVHREPVTITEAQSMDLPLSCPWGDEEWEEDPESTLGEQRYNWPLILVVYLKDDADWKRAANAVTADVMSAVFRDESLNNSGSHFIHLPRITKFWPDTKGGVGAVMFESRIVFDLLRGATP